VAVVVFAPLLLVMHMNVHFHRSVVLKITSVTSHHTPTHLHVILLTHSLSPTHHVCTYAHHAQVGSDCHVRANAQWTFTEPTTGTTYGNTVWDEAGGIAQVVAANGSIIGAPPAEWFGRPGTAAVVAATPKCVG
jgi:hypothetical protein